MRIIELNEKLFPWRALSETEVAKVKLDDKIGTIDEENSEDLTFVAEALDKLKITK